MTEKKQVEKKQAETIVDRIKHPAFIAAATGFIYTFYRGYAVPKFNAPEIPEGDFRIFVDLIAYALIGTGVYSTFNKKVK